MADSGYIDDINYDDVLVTRGSSRRSGAIPFSSLILVILNSLPGEITPRGEGRRGRRLPFYPMYIELEARLLSFQSMSFDGPDMTDLARAGFFVKRQNGNSVCCYHCGVLLNDWDRDDDPWVEHAWWFPECRFLKETRGERFIQLVQRQSQEEDRFHRRMHTEVVENDTDMTQEVKTQIKAIFEAKFTEDDVLLAIKKFMEQNGRRPFLSEFYEFINNWQGMPSRKKPFEKLIKENINFRQENRAVRDDIRDLQNEKRSVEDENRAVKDENRALKDENRALHEELGRMQHYR